MQDHLDDDVDLLAAVVTHSFLPRAVPLFIFTEKKLIMFLTRRRLIIGLVLLFYIGVGSLLVIIPFYEDSPRLVWLKEKSWGLLSHYTKSFIDNVMLLDDNDEISSEWVVFE